MPGGPSSACEERSDVGCGVASYHMIAEKLKHADSLLCGGVGVVGVVLQELLLCGEVFEEFGGGREGGYEVLSGYTIQ